ncbi:MAG: lipopolysaccharide biosynthesis protein [Arenicella sp.]|jgi:lipopolysaccharide biosynthesis protein
MATQALKLSSSIGVLLHVYYVDILPSLSRVLPHFPDQITLLVSTPEEHVEVVRNELSSLCPSATLVVKGVQNLGFDIAPMLISFAQELLGLGIVCKLHTKHSQHYDRYAGWREHLIHNLAGSKQIVSAVLRKFSEDEGLGALFPGAFPNLKCNMRWNPALMDAGGDLLTEFNILPESSIDFPAGSMFWFRPAAMKALWEQHWQWKDFEFEGEEGLAHVVERIILYLLHGAGYSWEKINYIGRAVEPAMQTQNHSNQTRLAVVLHVWSTQGLHKVMRSLKNIQQGFDLWVTISSDQRQEVAQALEQHSDALHNHIIEVPNVGHDVSAFFQLGSELAAYDLVCKLHLKQSSVDWFDYLLDNLLGGAVEVEVILAMFARNPQLGVLYPKTFPPIHKHMSWGSNLSRAQRIAQEIGLPDLNPERIDFVSSTMFWCRPQALQPLFEYKNYQFRAEHNRLNDGGESHAVERLILDCAKHVGYHVRSICLHSYSGDPDLEIY